MNSPIQMTFLSLSILMVSLTATNRRQFMLYPRNYLQLLPFYYHISRSKKETKGFGFVFDAYCYGIEGRLGSSDDNQTK
ncbi:uncharacterized protein EV154DRAFT_514314 [Mucor mucedo]|uniref:uncharacterized protein n=1 Tax=Mucor mucedo TaxID=29922 RepID=UPI00221FEB1D|nr:uncharacterized protein EV154DRAFT_514314 [Mucor mucedo]KAI7889614.1 hypothetical protein EV154DRAFT_514314 [Mucor mucedo]